MAVDLRTGIVEAARAAGISPVDLATVISYETAGTFDPLKKGPTTKWGQHRGLIQFGEPQAKQYGVDWNDPLGSQLGPDGAVVKYLRDAGVKPGMGRLDLYSAINAGGVGPKFYGRSDTAAGGAPGTVKDKVEQQMAGHEAKAMALLGGEFSPTPAPAVSPQMPTQAAPAAGAAMPPPPGAMAPTGAPAAVGAAPKAGIMDKLMLLAATEKEQAPPPVLAMPQAPAQPNSLAAYIAQLTRG